MVQVEAVRAFDDNYIWMLINPSTQQAFAVDPGDAKPVQAFLQSNNLDLAGILITHHHWDHTGGVAELKQIYTHAHVYGPTNSPFEGSDTQLAQGQSVTVFGIPFTIEHTPGHTLDHICYINPKMVFCGDTLFSGGCGRLFEGSPAQMWQSLTFFKTLADDTLVYCTHEYTQANLAFAKAAEPNNQVLARYFDKVVSLRGQDIITLPSTIGLEKQINPFLRADSIDTSVIPEKFRCEQATPSACFASLRSWKDNF